MDISIFTEKNQEPNFDNVKKAIGETYIFWQEIYSAVYELYPAGIDKWNFPGKKYGWSFSIKDKKRAIIYFLPRDGFFKIAFVFGQKAFDEIMTTDIQREIKAELVAAKKYAEGRGIQIPVMDDKNFSDIKKLIEIKLKY